MTSDANSFINLWHKLNNANPSTPENIPLGKLEPEIISIARQAKKTFLDRKIQHCLRLEWELSLGLTENQKLIKEHLTDLQLKKKFKNALENNNGFVYITVSPPPNTPIDKILKVALKQSKRSFVKNYWYVIEQRGDSLSTFKNGVHIHFLIERNLELSFVDKPGKVCKNLQKGFGVLFPIKNKMRKFIEAQNYAYALGNQFAIDLTYKDSRLNYMLGYKKDLKKLSKLPYDLLLRKEFDIPNIFTNVENNYIYNPEIKIISNK